MKYLMTALLILFLYAFFNAQYKNDTAIPENQMFIANFSKQSNATYRGTLLETQRMSETSEFSITINPNSTPILVDDKQFLTCSLALIAQRRSFSKFIILNQITDGDTGSIVVGYGNEEPNALIKKFIQDYPAITAREVLTVAQFSTDCANYNQYARITATDKLTYHFTDQLKTILGPNMKLFERW